jgi:hypothetical protein
VTSTHPAVGAPVGNGHWVDRRSPRRLGDLVRAFLAEGR